MELIDDNNSLILDTDRQAAAAWSYLLGAAWPPSPELRVLLDRAEAFARERYPTNPPPASVEDTDETCIDCRHTVEDYAHMDGCSSCPCPRSFSGQYGQH